MTDFSFKRGERLKSRKTINQLFSNGESFGQYPLRLVWTVVEVHQNEFPVQFAVSVPKRRFSKAVDRNRIKRQVREAYRLHKHQLYEALSLKEEQIALMVIYIGKTEMRSKEIDKAMRKSIRRFLKNWSSEHKPTNPN